MIERVNQKDIDMNKRRYLNGKNKVLNCPNISNENKEDFTKFLRIKQIKENVSYARLGNVCSVLYQLPTLFFKNKRIVDLQEDDFIDLMENLKEGTIVSEKGTPFTEETILSKLRVVKSYLKTMLGDTEFKNRFGDIKLDNPDLVTSGKILTYNQVKELVDKIPYEKQDLRFLIMFMFDTGCRSQDLRFLRIKDFFLDEDGDLMVNLPKLKTFERTIQINLFKPQIQAYVFDYLMEQQRLNINSYVISNLKGEPIAHQVIGREFKQVVLNHFGKEFEEVTLHKIRHSSATYYAKQSNLSFQQFCYRFGWSTSSKAASRYFMKKDLGKTKVRQAMANDEIQKYELENKDLRDKYDELKNEIRNLADLYIKDKEKSLILEKMALIFYDKLNLKEKNELLTLDKNITTVIQSFDKELLI